MIGSYQVVQRRMVLAVNFFEFLIIFFCFVVAIFNHAQCGGYSSSSLTANSI